MVMDIISVIDLLNGLKNSIRNGQFVFKNIKTWNKVIYFRNNCYTSIYLWINIDSDLNAMEPKGLLIINGWIMILKLILSMSIIIFKYQFLLITQNAILFRTSFP